MKRLPSIRSMMCICPVLLCAVSTLLISCIGDFPNRPDRIDDTRVRQLGFTYHAAEMAPGDTVTVTALFSGEPVDRIVWRVGFDFRFDPLGTTQVDTALNWSYLDTASLRVGELSAIRNGEGFQSATASFRLPRDIIRRNLVLPQYPFRSLPDSVKGQIPELFQTITSDQIVDIVESIAYGDSGSVLFPPEIVRALAALLSVRVKVFAEAYSGETVYRTQGTFVVRYHKPLQRSLSPSQIQLPINHNPRIRWFGVYKVKKRGLSRFNPRTDPYDYDLFRLFVDRDSEVSPNDTFAIGPGRNVYTTNSVPIDTGYSYFLGADTDSSGRDPVYMQDGRIGYEEYFFDWYYRTGVSPGVHPDSILALSGRQDSLVSFSLPVDATQSVYDFHILLYTYDYFFAGGMRTRGSHFAGAACRLELTDAYVENLRKRRK